MCIRDRSVDETMENNTSPTAMIEIDEEIHETTDNNANDDSVNRNEIKMVKNEQDEGKTVDIEQVIIENNENPEIVIKQEDEQDDPLEVKNETIEAITTSNHATRRNSLEMIKFFYDENNV